MTDMTAEQALEWLRTIAAISGAVVSDRPLSFSYQEAVKFQAAVKALTAPRVQWEPVAWMHDSPGRVDVIHAEVKKLLVDSHDAAGHLHRPLDKSEHYTIPLYTAPQPAPDVSALVEALECALEVMENVDGENDCSRGIDAVEEALSAHRKQQENDHD